MLVTKDRYFYLLMNKDVIIIIIITLLLDWMSYKISQHIRFIVINNQIYICILVC